MRLQIFELHNKQNASYILNPVEISVNIINVVEISCARNRSIVLASHTEILVEIEIPDTPDDKSISSYYNVKSTATILTLPTGSMIFMAFL